MPEPFALDRVLCAMSVFDAPPTALAWAASLAGALDVPLTVVATYEPASGEHSPQYEHDLAAGAWERFTPLVECCGLSPDSATLFEGAIEDGMIAAVDEHEPDLVVVRVGSYEGATSLGYGGLGHFLAHRMACPLIAVPSAVDAHAAPIGGPLEAQPFVVGVDGSPISLDALAWTDALARAVNARCVAVHIVERDHDDELFDVLSPVRVELATVEAAAERLGVELVEETGNDPAAIVRAVAIDRNAALTVVAARQREADGGRVLGRVVDRLLHEPPGPVAVLPSHYLERRNASR